MHPGSRINPDDPQPAKIPLFPPAVNVSIYQSLLQLVISVAENILLAPPIAFSLTKNPPTTLPRSYSVFSPHSLIGGLLEGITVESRFFSQGDPSEEPAYDDET